MNGNDREFENMVLSGGFSNEAAPKKRNVVENRIILISACKECPHADYFAPLVDSPAMAWCKKERKWIAYPKEIAPFCTLEMPDG